MSMHYLMKSLKRSSETARVRVVSWVAAVAVTGAVYASIYGQANMIVA